MRPATMFRRNGPVNRGRPTLLRPSPTEPGQTRPIPIVRLIRAQWRVPLRILGRALTNFIDDGGSRMAAAISYYALFSLFPITLLAVSIFGIVLRAPGVQEQVLNAIITFLPTQDQSIADSLRNVAKLGPTLTIVSALGSIWTAGALSAAVRSALDVAFDVTVGRPWLRAKLIDYALLPIIGLPLLGGVVLTAAWRVVRTEFGRAWAYLDSPVQVPFADTGIASAIGALVVPFALSFVAFLLMYRLLPNRRVRVRDMWPGALLAAVGFEALKAGFAWYVEQFGSFNLIYGSLGSVIVLLFWVYLVANLVIFGGEVAAEVPHVLRGEPRHGRWGSGPDGEGDWRMSALSLLRGLVFADDRSVVGLPPVGAPGAPAPHEADPGMRR